MPFSTCHQSLMDTSLTTNYYRFKKRAVQNRNVFLNEYSHAANRPRLLQIIEDRINASPVVPLEFENLLKLHGRIWQ